MQLYDEIHDVRIDSSIKENGQPYKCMVAASGDNDTKINFFDIGP
jgi:hypothetical protein